MSCNGNSVSFADIVQRGNIDRNFTEEELGALPVKAPSERNLMGVDIKALDIPAKTDGSATYGIDVEIEGMLYARPLIPPTRYGSKIIAVLSPSRAARRQKSEGRSHKITPSCG